MKISIIGYGFVGKSMKKFFKDAVVYDPQEGYLENKEEAFNTDLAFICVPTPNTDSGELDDSIVEEIVSECNSTVICIRSTVMPGTTDKLKKKYGKRIIFHPEFLGETPLHPMELEQSKYILLGGDKKDNRVVIDAYTQVLNAHVTIRQVEAIEAEVIKISDNRAVAFKVAECQELYDVCELAGIDYYVVREGVYGDDPRFNYWWSFVYPEKRGMASKCLPKDIIGWCAWAESLGYDARITKRIIEKNNEWLRSNTAQIKK